MSTSARRAGRSPGRFFYRALALLVVALGAGIVVLAVLVTTSGPRVRHAALQNLPGGEVSVADQSLTLVFDRPVEGVDVERAVEVRPEADHTITHRKGQINLSFDKNLLHDTEYTITVAPKLRDDLGKEMAGGYSYRFTTAEPSFTYLERNYGEGEPDRVVEKAPLSGESRTLFEADRIKHFARSGEQLAVVLPRQAPPGGPGGVVDDLRLVDLDGGESTPVGVPGEVQVDNLRFSPTGAQFVFVTRALPETGASGPYVKAYGNKLYLFEGQAGGDRLRSVDTLSDAGNVASALYSNDGQALLYRTLDGTHYLTGAPGDDRAEPSLLGSYGVEGGFDRTNTKLAFQGNDGVVGVYDARTRRLRKLPDLGTGARISAPTFLHNSDDLVYREDLFDPFTGELRFRVNVADESGKPEPALSVKPPSGFLGEPRVSLDDRYLLIEAASDSLGLDDYAGNPQPKDTRLVLYDRHERRVLDSGTRGMDPTWDR
jgi:hypothetical protein